jgi:hypothetical protein
MASWLKSLSGKEFAASLTSCATMDDSLHVAMMWFGCKANSDLAGILKTKPLWICLLLNAQLPLHHKHQILVDITS